MFSSRCWKIFSHQGVERYFLIKVLKDIFLPIFLNNIFIKVLKDIFSPPDCCCCHRPHWRVSRSHWLQISILFKYLSYILFLMLFKYISCNHQYHSNISANNSKKITWFGWKCWYLSNIWAGNIALIQISEQEI